MATYKEIQIYVKQKYSFVPKTCWIAHVKKLSGLDVRPAPNRRGLQREEPCPPEKRAPIHEALQHFGTLVH